ncbi:thiamine phosphate synthase [Acidobacteria bacterium AH-259-O06]|nr:thiamine phosphate synthase [Acidobacteria bacterium AH-259-O06]
MLTFNNILEKRNLQPPVLYGISDRLAFPQLDPFDYLELLFQTRAHILQWREKDLSVERNRVFIRSGVRLARQTGKLFLVNSLFEVALEEGASGTHLTSSQDVGDARKARDQFAAKQFLLGKSVHTLREAEMVESKGVDYILLGPIFDPLSKESDRPPLGTPALREAVQMLYTPVVAVGGIDESNFEAVFRTGVSGAAGISWVQREIERLLQGR